MNSVVISGRIATDLEVKTTTTGKKNCKFKVAVKRDKDNSDFIECIAWESKVDFLTQFFNKGKAIEVYGELRNDSWEKDGQKHSKTYVLAQRVDFAITEKKIEVSEKPTSFGKLDIEDLPFD